MFRLQTSIVCLHEETLLAPRPSATDLWQRIDEAWHACSNPHNRAHFLCRLTGGMPQHINRHPKLSNGWLRLRRCLHPLAASQGGTGSSSQYPRWKRRKISRAIFRIFNLSVIAYRRLSHGRSRPAVFCRLSFLSCLVDSPYFIRSAMQDSGGRFEASGAMISSNVLAPARELRQMFYSRRRAGAVQAPRVEKDAESTGTYCPLHVSFACSYRSTSPFSASNVRSSRQRASLLLPAPLRALDLAECVETLVVSNTSSLTSSASLCSGFADAWNTFALDQSIQGEARKEKSWEMLC